MQSCFISVLLTDRTKSVSGGCRLFAEIWCSDLARQTRWVERGCGLTREAALGQESAFAHRSQMKRDWLRRKVCSKASRQNREAEHLRAINLPIIGGVQNRTPASYDIVVAES